MAKQRKYKRDLQGRFATVSASAGRKGQNSSKRSRAATAGLAAAGALGALYATDGKGAFKTAGLVAAIGASAAQGVRTNRQKRRRR